MSAITVAVFGYGTVGKPLVADLLQNGANVVLFSRDASKLTEIPSQVKTESVDYNDDASIALLLKKNHADVVVCVLAGDFDVITKTQVGLARAAKEAGAQLFVPNEFGLNTDGYPSGTLFGAKYDATKALNQVGVPTLRIITGAFIEYIPWLTGSSKHPEKVAITGKGETKFSFTSIPDISGYLAYVLTHYSFAALSNQVLLIEGQAASLREVADILGKEVVAIEGEELHPLAKVLQEVGELGALRVGYEYSKPDTPSQLVTLKSGSGNVLWEGHQWKTIADVFGN
ncbi:NAD(P)-binding protein [Cylindrobasidium torrendii FP15055 ss-10]|uniref:NAD(P)-binding protein n=1 Tax=Cylindrobasidium torrendii FP15055 ss-10 TaxID=1314674 RepID=A0A0D7B8I4_9AGAR|nr:NAD(P)-binding protein [Cylindrobasidium torrendii FP15055 ss-10]